MVAILAQSDDALETLRHAEETLDRFSVAWATSVAHDAGRVVPDLQNAGVAIFIVANTSTAPLSSGVAELTSRPVLAVPIANDDLPAIEALESTLAPGRAPVASLAVGRAGAINAALLAVAILANADPRLRQKLKQFRQEQTDRVLADRLD